MADSPKINRLCFEKKHLTMGTMGTQKVSPDSHDLHYFAKTNAKGEVDIFYLKPDGSPTVMVAESVTEEEFNQRFFDCSTHKCELQKKSAVEIKAEKVEEMVRQGNEHLEKKEFNSATFEFGKALKADDRQLDAHLGKGKAHLALGEVEKAKEHFEKMANIDELYDEKHKHVFNELGIELRRTGMHEEAVRNYTKALEIDPKDEAIYYNLARVHKESGKKDEAMEYIKKALELKPDFAEAKTFLKSLA